MRAFIKENRQLLSWLAVLTMTLFTLYAASAVPEFGVTYYNFSDVDDKWSSNDATNNGAASDGTYYPVFDVSGNSAPTSFYFDGSDDVSYPAMTSINTLSVWIKPFAAITTSSTEMTLISANNDYDAILFGSSSGVISNEIITIATTGASGKYCYWSSAQISNIGSGKWTNLIFTYTTGGQYRLYINGTDQGLCTKYSTPTYLTFGAGMIGKKATGSYFKGNIDEVQFYNTTYFSQANASAIYANGTLEPYITPSFFSVTASDYWDDSAITSFWAYIDGIGNYSTTNGTAITSLFQNDTNTYDLTIGAADYFTREYSSQAVSANLEAELYASDIQLRAYELITGDELTANFTINATTKAQNETFYLSPGAYDVTASKTGYFSVSDSFNVSALENKTINVTDLYSSILKINGSNAYTGSAINTFSGWIYHHESANNRTYSTTNGTAYAAMIPGQFLIYIEAENYSVSDENLENITIASSSYNLTFDLYTSNSILITIRDEGTGNIITQNITIVVTGANETTYYTTTGSYFLDNLTDGNYSIKFSGDNYTIRQYAVTVAENSFQNLAAYLTASNEEVIMTYIDEDSGATLEGVSASMSRLIGGVWTVVQSKESDITSRIQFIYTPSIKYRFTSSKTGYDTKIFYLDPILFDEYNVKMSKETTIMNAPAYYGVSVSVTPSEYFNDAINNFTITFSSPDGFLESYDYNITAPTGLFYSGNGSNAYGGTSNHSLNITGATMTSMVTLNYCYDTSIGEEICFTRIYLVRDFDTSAGVFSDNKLEHYGLGIFERILVVVIVTIIVTGILSILGGILLGAPIGLLLMGYLTAIGFMPLWAALPSFLVGFIIIVARSS